MKYVTVGVAAKRLHCSDETVRRYLASGELDGFQRSNHGWWMVSSESIETKVHKVHTPIRKSPLILAEYAR